MVDAARNIQVCLRQGYILKWWSLAWPPHLKMNQTFSIGIRRIAGLEVQSQETMRLKSRPRWMIHVILVLPWWREYVAFSLHPLGKSRRYAWKITWQLHESIVRITKANTCIKLLQKAGKPLHSMHWGYRCEGWSYSSTSSVYIS